MVRPYLHVNVTRFSDTGTPLARLSLARWNYVKTVEFFDPFLSPPNNPVILVFRELVVVIKFEQGDSSQSVFTYYDVACASFYISIAYVLDYT